MLLDDLQNDYKGFLFDLDGVLIDSLAAAKTVVPKVLADLDIPKNYIEKVSNEFIEIIFGFSIDDFWREISKHLSSSFSTGRAVQLYLEYRSLSELSLIQNVVNFALSCKSKNLAICLVSNNIVNTITDTLNKSGLNSIFTNVVGIDSPNSGKKPLPLPYLAGAKLLGLDPSECLVLEDSKLGAESASIAGADVVGVASNSSGLENLKECDYFKYFYNYNSNELCLHNKFI